MSTNSDNFVKIGLVLSKTYGMICPVFGPVVWNMLYSPFVISTVTEVKFIKFSHNVAASSIAVNVHIYMTIFHLIVSSSATIAMFTYTTHLSKYRSGHTAQVRSMGFMHVKHE